MISGKHMKLFVRVAPRLMAFSPGQDGQILFCFLTKGEAF